MAPVCLSHEDPAFRDVTTVSDAAMVRVRVRHYGLDYFSEFRCLIGAANGHGVQVARFTYPTWDLWEYGEVDVTLFPPIATVLFARLAQFWSNGHVQDDSQPAPITYLDGLPVYYPTTTDSRPIVLFASPYAAPVQG